MALLFLVAFFWAMNDGQNDDMSTPAIRILFEDEKPDESQKTKKTPPRSLNHKFPGMYQIPILFNAPKI